MKKLLFLLAVTFSIASFAEDASWTEENKSSMVKGCENAYNNRSNKTDVNYIEHSGVEIRDLCKCSAEKFIETYQSQAVDGRDEIKAAIRKTIEICKAELVK